MVIQNLIAASFKVDQKAWAEFKAASEPLKASFVLRALIDQFNDGSIKLKVEPRGRANGKEEK